MNRHLYKSIRKAFTALPGSIHKHFLPEQQQTLMERFRWLLACGKIICPEYRFKWPQLDWWQDANFNEYLKLFDEEQGMNTDRRWNLLQFLQSVNHIPGDTAECGSYRGASSFLTCAANRRAQTKRLHHIFDSFEGLSEPSEQDGTHWKKNALNATEDELRAHLRQFAQEYSVYKGWIPDRFHEVADLSFAFVHIDVDLFQPTLDSVRFFYPRINAGGILICDDYGFSTCPGATKAIDTFMSDKPEPIIRLASGGCIIFRQGPNAAISLHHAKQE